MRVLDKKTTNFWCLKYNINLASKKDKSPMKVKALIQRGAKKGFNDVYELFKELFISEIKDLLISKYSANNINFYQLLKSLTIFEDIEKEHNLISLKQITCEKIKSLFIIDINNLNENFIQN